MQYSVPGESHTLAFFFLSFFDGSEGFIVQGGRTDQVPLPGQKLKAFIPMEMSKISVSSEAGATGRVSDYAELTEVVTLLTGKISRETAVSCNLVMLFQVLHEINLNDLLLTKVTLKDSPVGLTRTFTVVQFLNDKDLYLMIGGEGGELNASLHSGLGQESHVITGCEKHTVILSVKMSPFCCNELMKLCYSPTKRDRPEPYFAHAVVMQHVLFVAITQECFCLLAGCKVFVMDKSS
ncbi:hypothetical protein EK904_009980 [Melospiza melodia maxima]|nr:hypothetical protein EK904_009980 [Melospiza melodia maxima]